MQYNTFRGIVTGISERLSISILSKFTKQAFIKDLTHFTITQTFYKTEHECNIKPPNQIWTAKVTTNYHPQIFKELWDNDNPKKEEEVKNKSIIVLK